MKKVILGVLFLFIQVNLVMAQTDMVVETPPKVIEITADGEAIMGPAFYPVFSDFSGDNPRCAAYLSRTFDAAKPNTVDGNGFSLAPICNTSVYPNSNGWRAADTCPTETLIQGLQATNIEIPEDFRSSGRLLVSWTVRIEGFKPDIQIPPMFYNNPGIHPNLCWGWHGTFKIAYPGGNVETQLYVNGKKKGQVFMMQIPTAGQINMYQAYDPTLTGKYLLQASDFLDGKLPSKINSIEIRWINKTPLKVVSKKGYRNLIIEFMPVGR